MAKNVESCSASAQLGEFMRCSRGWRAQSVAWKASTSQPLRFCLKKLAEF